LPIPQAIGKLLAAAFAGKRDPIARANRSAVSALETRG
jgi:hypothetical protein